jgi:PAS domain S-box-containing protein
VFPQGLNPATPAADSSGIGILANVSLRVDHDLVWLRRRVRVAAEQCGLDDRGVHSLSAASYEAARLLLSKAGTADAAIVVSPASELQVVVSASTAEAAQLTDSLAQPLAALQAAVERVSLQHIGSAVAVTLAASIPVRAGAVRTAPATADSWHPLPAASADAADENARLRQTMFDMQSELDETNRGVIALYAEVDAQADRLRQAEDRLRVLLDSVQDYAICMVAVEGTIETWNAGGERLFGYAAAEIVGRSVECFYSSSERDLGVPAAHLREARSAGRLECECVRVRRDGSRFDALVLLTAMRRPGGALRGFSLVVRDITERKRLEDDLRRRADELSAANRAKEDFLATLSHELRTPLNAMLGWTRLLRMGKLDTAGMTRALDTIERNAHVQEQLIADILDVSRIVTGKLRLELRPMDLEPIVDASIDALRPAADAKGIDLSRTVTAAGTVMGDPDRLQQVVWNLLANAIKFTPSGGRVSLSLAREGSTAVVGVADTGEGIPSTLLPFIFDRFTQGDASVTRPHGGLGLGLSIVRHIVELHGGQVRAASEGPGKGSTFRVHLPVRVSQRRGEAPGS